MPITETELAFVREAGDEVLLAQFLVSLGIAACQRDQLAEAEELLADVASFQGIPEKRRAGMLLWLGWTEMNLGKIEAAGAHYQESYRIFRKNDHRKGMAFALSKLGVLEDEKQNYREGLRYHEEGRLILAEFGDLAGEGYTTSRMSLSTYALGDYEQAYQMALLGLDAFTRVGHGWGIGTSLCRAGYAALKLGKAEESIKLFLRALDLAPLAPRAFASLLLRRTGLDLGPLLLGFLKVPRRFPRPIL